jgi:exopolysaccharide biosynthesis polyprenyl glycosylphosphotransferase
MLLFHRKHFAGRLIFPFNVLIAIGVLLRGVATGILPFIRKLTFIAIDAAIVNLAQIAAFYIKLGGPAQPHFNAYLRAAPLVTGTTVLIMWVSKLYTGEKDRDSVQVTYETIRALAATAGVIVLANFISRSFASLAFPYPRFVFLLGWAIAVIPISVIKALILSRTVRRRAATRIGIIGTGEPANRLKGELEERLSAGSRLIGFVTNQPVETTNGPILGLLDDIEAIIRRFALTDIIITAGAWPPHRLMHLVAGCENSGVAVKILPNLYEILIGKFEITNLAGMPLIKLPTDPLGGWYRALKRTGDMLGGALGLALFSWIFPFVAVAIRLSSPGPIFFRQVRVGRNEREFTLLKFRTMILDAERESGPTLATPHDPRVTRVGSFLRLTHLDELPQLFNIVRGEMSFVGPRPERPEFVELFVERDPTYRRRFVVRPGLTGLAQVHGRYDSEPSDKLKFDLAYVNNVNFALDLRVLLSSIKTIAAAFTKSFGNGPS